MPSPAPIPFVKATACGNDFLIIEGIDSRADFSGLSRKMCDRRTGVGADGVEFLFPDAHADVHARLFNADGSEAEISGNGTRCVAAYLCSKDYREKIVVRTGAGIKTCALISRNEREYEFETAMGEPKIGQPVTIPLVTKSFHGLQVCMGNPHFVAIVDEFPQGWQLEAAAIGRQPAFKHGINVEFLVIEDKSNISVRFYERGVGETQSSGTGSCAAAIAAITAKQTESPVRVHTVGGMQTVRWKKNEVFLRGTAVLIFRGLFFV